MRNKIFLTIFCGFTFALMESNAVPLSEKNAFCLDYVKNFSTSIYETQKEYNKCMLFADSLIAKYENEKIIRAQQLKKENEKWKLDTPKREALERKKAIESYHERIRNRVEPNINMEFSKNQNLEVLVDISLKNDGSILRVNVQIPSGNSQWDIAVLEALHKTAILPRDENGKVPQTLSILFKSN
jgi:TonB family protein